MYMFTAAAILTQKAEYPSQYSAAAEYVKIFTHSTEKLITCRAPMQKCNQGLCQIFREATILPGVTVAHRQLCANAMVVNDVPENMVVAGTPAKNDTRATQ